jgi:CheY-like chemotaxis protein/HPt (histidine-containing phosphotransfer) domain-containing protein
MLKHMKAYADEYIEPYHIRRNLSFMGNGYDKTAITGSEGTGTGNRSGAPAPETTLSAFVLVAEDNPVNQEIAVMMLEAMGCRVDWADTGREAVDMALKNPYDLILMDCRMPAMDGFAATGLIREREEEESVLSGERRRKTIIAMTGNTSAEDRDFCLSKGMDDFLKKPFTFEEMQEIVVRWLPVGSAQNPSHFTEEVLSTGDSPIEEAYLDNIRALQREGGPDILGKVLDNYFSDAAKAVGELAKAVFEGNCEEIRTIAHRFKSGSANVGAIRLSEVCREMENGASAMTAAELKEIFFELEKEYEAVKGALAAVRQGLER